jgi:membrane protein implicated in regulation of membrane protease activity
VLGFAIVKLVALPFGGIGSVAWFWGFLLVAAVIAVLVLIGRRRQARAREKAAEERAAAMSGRR